MSKVLQIALTGAIAVGKSALIDSLVRNSFSDQYESTIEDWNRTEMEVDGVPWVLEIRDGQTYEYPCAVMDQWIVNTEAFVLVYDITRASSLESVEELGKWIIRIKQQTAVDQVPMVLIGNKVDLSDRRDVSMEEGQRVASTLNCPFFEVSAKAKLRVKESFEQLVREAIRYRKEEPEVASSSRRCITM